MAMSAGRCGQHQDQENWGTTRILQEHQSLRKHGSKSWVWDLSTPEWAPTWHHLLTTLFNIFPSVKSGEAEVWHLQPKIFKFHGYWVYPETSNPGNSEPWQSKLKDNKEPQLCPITMPEQNQRERKDKSSSSQNWLSQAKLRLVFTLSAWISLNYSLNP